MAESKVARVFHAMNQVKLELASKGGITKDRDAPKEIGGYAFRGIDDLDNVLCGLTAKHGLLLVPRVVAHRAQMQQNERGKLQKHVEVDMEIDVISSEDGSALPHPLRATGEGIDSGDKATGKATSNARKIAVFAAFMVPTHGENVEEYATQVEQPKMPTPEQLTQAAEQGMGAAAVAAEAVKPKPGPKKTKAEPKPDPTVAWAGNNPTAAQADPNALMGRIGEINTFPLLHAFATEANGMPDGDAKIAIFDAIRDRVIFLFARSQNVAEVKEGLPLVKAMGNPLELVKAGNEAYARHRQPPQPQGAA